MENRLIEQKQRETLILNVTRTGVTIVLLLSFPQIDIIGAVVIVWRVRGKLSGLFSAILCATIVHSAMHTHMNRLTVLWIGFCLTGPISLCLNSFLYCVLLCVVCMCRFVTQ